VQDKLVLTGRDLLHDLPGEFRILKCLSCGLMRTSPRPTPATIGVYYPDNYGPYIGTKVLTSPKQSLLKRLLRPFVRRIFAFNAEALPPLPPGRLLEIGCASGAFLHKMAQQGWEVQGIEYSPTAAAAARALGYPVHIGALESAPQTEEPVDLIVGWMVLEHLHDPVPGLQKLRACAKEGAWLVLSVPNAGSLEFRLFGRNWYALQLPTHMHHFTPETISKTLSTAGWRVRRVVHQRTLANLFASFGYTLRDHGCRQLSRRLILFPERAGLWHYVLFPVALLLSTFGQTGRMTVWAQVDESN
jgi:2-polyprenyl-3-methyl-5-hydroxy-6-metoxy-1,4-benzoquinol methylase